MKNLIFTTFFALIVNLTIFGQNFIHSNNGQLNKDYNPIELKGLNFWAYDDEYPNTDFPYDYNWYANEFNEASFGEIHNTLCFNVVRLNMDFRFFENDANPNVYMQAGWDWLDEKILWARNNNVYLILDMHTPQGGYQSFGFTGNFWGSSQQDINNRTRFTNLWKEIADRYKNDTIIAGFDLINEAMPNNNSSYWTLIQQTVNQIRTVDINHLIIVEEAFNADFQWQSISDNNYCIDFHFYNPWDFVANENASPYTMTLEQLKQEMLDQGLQFALDNNIPLNIGEYGIKREVLERQGSNWEVYLNQLHTLFDTYNLSRQIWNYHANYWGLHEPYNNTLPNSNNVNTILYSYYEILCNTSSVNETGFYEMNIYPNPADEYIIIETKMTNYQIDIVDISGKTHKTINANGNNKIGISDLPPSIYFIKIYNNIKYITTVKMIKI